MTLNFMCVLFFGAHVAHLYSLYATATATAVRTLIEVVLTHLIQSIK